MEMVSNPRQDQFLHPILVHSIFENKENIDSQMGHTKKNVSKKRRYFLAIGFNTQQM